MKIRIALCSTAAVLAMSALAPAIAQDKVIVADPVPYSGERIYVPAVRPSGALHGGFVTAADEQLLSDTLAALSADRTIRASIVTVVAKNGELIMSGNASDAQTAARIESVAKRVANGRVTAFISTATG